MVRFVGFFILINWAIIIYTKIVAGPLVDIFWICYVNLFICSLGFIFKNQRMITFGFIGSFPLMIIFLLNSLSFIFNGYFLIPYYAKTLSLTPWYFKIASLFHIWLPFVCFLAIDKVKKNTWVLNSLLITIILSISLFFGERVNLNLTYRLFFFEKFYYVEIFLLPFLFFLKSNNRYQVKNF